MIYLDHSATSPMKQATVEAMWPYFTEYFANASSQHEAGKLAAAGLHAARQVVAEILNAEPTEILFTSGGTEGDNLAIKGLSLAAPRGRHLVTSAIEHEAVLESCDYLCRHHGFRVTKIRVDKEGFVDLEALARSLDADTTLCSIQHANNEVGTVQPINEIAKLCEEKGVPLHVDAVQSAGLLPLPDVDLLSVSAHKFGGPKGVGVLRKKSTVFLEPLLHGGGQESGLRSGTSNVAGAVGLAAALHAATEQQNTIKSYLGNLRDQLVNGVLGAWPTAVLTGSAVHRLPHHASFCFPGVSGESVLLDLEAHGIACSSGSACAAGNQEPSPVLVAMGFEPELAETAVRFTLGPENTAEEIERVLDYFRTR